MSVSATEHGWILATRETAYTLGFASAGSLVHGYWGPRLPYSDDYPVPVQAEGWVSFNGPAHLSREEYPAWAGPSYIEPCLKATFADGVRDVVLRRESVELEEEALHIRLRDTVYPLLVTLHYRVHPNFDLIERWVTLSNEGELPITLERAFSAQWHLPRATAYRLTHVNGRWLDEMRLVRETLTPGSKILESRRLTTSHHHNPWFAIDRGSADEESGEVWFGVLAWSGNWKLVVESTEFAMTRVSSGLNDWDFAWRLGAGQVFTTPSAYAGYTRGGFGAASRCLHDFIRETVVPHTDTVRKVLYNSWEATFFAVNEQGQLELARRAAAMGVELFVLDDGWFSRRVSDTAGLGDWWPDTEKFPRGLGPLIEGVNALGMDFGLWVEPEMVNPDSDLYRAHPSWVLHFPTRVRTEMRNQLILNLARSDVQDYLIAQLDYLLTHNKISFIKWDMNRNVSEPGWPDAPGEPRELWVRYVLGLYHVWGTLRARHPEVIWQSCSGGGGRADLGILRLADQVWISDNTGAAARLAIQEGFTQIFPASTMEAWVTDADQGSLPLQFRFHVSMCGLLGIGGNLLHWSEEEHALATRLVAQYKAIRHIVQFGDLYRLRSPQMHAFSALEYLTKDRGEGVLCVFRTHIPHPVVLPLLYPCGLEPEARYTIESFAGSRSGLAWMRTGLEIKLGNFESVILRITRVA
ncbi:MAG TPA: alpha-galactosidase [Ktedonobacteraceae bacterium]